MKRADPKLAPGDVAEAMTWFKKTTGQDAGLIVLHPKNERYAKEAGDSVEVKYFGGCLAWEVWLSAGDTSPTVLSQPDEGVESTISCDKKENHTNAPIGRPSLDLPLERIAQLASEGLSCRAIADKLLQEGVEASYRTVARGIRKLQAELPMAET
jgi:hypothetical protein